MASGAGSPVPPEGRNNLLPLAVLLLTLAALRPADCVCEHREPAAGPWLPALARGSPLRRGGSVEKPTGSVGLLTENAVLAVGWRCRRPAARVLLTRWQVRNSKRCSPQCESRVLAFTIALSAMLQACLRVADSMPTLTSTRGALPTVRLRATPSTGGGRTRLQGAFVVTAAFRSCCCAPRLSLHALRSQSFGVRPASRRDRLVHLVLQNYPEARRTPFVASYWSGFDWFLASSRPRWGTSRRSAE